MNFKNFKRVKKFKYRLTNERLETILLACTNHTSDFKKLVVDNKTCRFSH